MISAFRMGRATGGRGLCDIDRVLARRKYIDVRFLTEIGLFSTCQDFPFFDT